LMLYGMLMDFGLIPRPNPKPDLPTTTKAGLHILHSSTFDHLSEDGTNIAMLFGDGRTALVADNIWKNRRLFLVDLAASATRELPLDRDDLSLSHFVYADQDILAIFYDHDLHDVIYRVSANGTLRRFDQYHEAGVVMQGKTPDVDVQGLLDAGELDGLINVQEEICEFDGSGYSTELGLVEYFYNDHTIVSSNVEEIKALLRGKSGRTVVDRCDRHRTERDAAVEIKLTRQENFNTRASDLDTLILKAEIWRNGALLKTLDFTPGELYFYVVPVGERLYFIGNNISYLELSELAGGR
jgi:hypothetical protein